MIHAGELTDRFRFERDDAAADDGTGQHVVSATVVCTRRALFAAGAVGPRFAALRQRFPVLQHAIALRYDSVTKTFTVPLRATSLVTGKILKALGTPLDPDGRKRELQLAMVEDDPIAPAVP